MTAPQTTNELRARWGLAKKSDAPKAPKQRFAVFSKSREDLRYWVETDRKTALHAFDLIEASIRDPFTGIGKPEPLKYLAPNVWSRRLTAEASHRLSGRRRSKSTFSGVTATRASVKASETGPVFRNRVQSDSANSPVR